jgi:hypothetical protein
MERCMRWALAGLLAGGLATATQAQQPQYAPVPTPQIDPELLKTPQPAPRTEPKPLKTDTGKDAPAAAIPQGIDIGKSKLDVDVKNDVTGRGIAPDSGETSNLQKVMPGQKQEPVLPDYFGLKLTTPTR